MIKQEFKFFKLRFQCDMEEKKRKKGFGGEELRIVQYSKSVCINAHSVRAFTLPPTDWFVTGVVHQNHSTV